MNIFKGFAWWMTFDEDQHYYVARWRWDGAVEVLTASGEEVTYLPLAICETWEELALLVRRTLTVGYACLLTTDSNQPSIE